MRFGYSITALALRSSHIMTSTISKTIPLATFFRIAESTTDVIIVCSLLSGRVTIWASNSFILAFFVVRSHFFVAIGTLLAFEHVVRNDSPLIPLFLLLGIEKHPYLAKP